MTEAFGEGSREAEELASWASMAPESLLRMLSAHGQHATEYALVLGVNVPGLFILYSEYA